MYAVNFCQQTSHLLKSSTILLLLRLKTHTGMSGRRCELACVASTVNLHRDKFLSFLSGAADSYLPSSNNQLHIMSHPSTALTRWVLHLAVTLSHLSHYQTHLTVSTCPRI